jgi:hypothetical protein
MLIGWVGLRGSWHADSGGRERHAPERYPTTRVQAARGGKGTGLALSWCPRWRERSVWTACACSQPPSQDSTDGRRLNHFHTGFCSEVQDYSTLIQMDFKLRLKSSPNRLQLPTRWVQVRPSLHPGRATRSHRAFACWVHILRPRRQAPAPRPPTRNPDDRSRCPALN